MDLASGQERTPTVSHVHTTCRQRRHTHPLPQNSLIRALRGRSWTKVQPLAVAQHPASQTTISYPRTTGRGTWARHGKSSTDVCATLLPQGTTRTPYKYADNPFASLPRLKLTVILSHSGLVTAATQSSTGTATLALRTCSKPRCGADIEERTRGTSSSRL